MNKELKIYTVWLFLLVFSFFYELPLVTLSFDRLNPRLFDVVFLIGIIIYARYNKSMLCTNEVYIRWKRVVLWFFVCAILSAMFLLSSSCSYFSLLAAFRYVESLIVLKIALSIPINKKAIFYATYCGLLFDSIYCIFQYGNPQVRELSPGVFVTVNFLTGPLSSSYFEIAQLLPLAAVVILSMVEDLDISRFKRNFVKITSVLMCWPILFTGSRTGLFLFLISLLVLLLYKKERSYILVLIFAVIGIIMFNRFDKDTSELYTITRAINLESTEHASASGRVEVSKEFNILRYDNAIALPFIGAGFDVAPIGGHNRIDYGIHSMYLYPLEQSGIVGFVLFITFLLFCLKYFYKKRDMHPLIMGAFAYLIAMMVTGIGAHNFWREFSSGNINTFIVLIYCLAYEFGKENKGAIS